MHRGDGWLWRIALWAWRRLIPCVPDPKRLTRAAGRKTFEGSLDGNAHFRLHSPARHRIADMPEDARALIENARKRFESGAMFAMLSEAIERGAVIAACIKETGSERYDHLLIVYPSVRKYRGQDAGHSIRGR